MYETVKIVNGHAITRMVGIRRSKFDDVVPAIKNFVRI